MPFLDHPQSFYTRLRSFRDHMDRGLIEAKIDQRERISSIADPGFRDHVIAASLKRSKEFVRRFRDLAVCFRDHVIAASLSCNGITAQ